MWSQTIVFVKFEENIKESSDNPLKNEDKDNDCPIQPVRTWIAQNIGFISDSSTIEEVEDLHHYKSGENKSEMS